MMTPNLVPEQSDRPSGDRFRKPTFVIATEGEKTEPNYFAYLDRKYQDINVFLLPADNGHTQPHQVLDKLLNKKQELDEDESKTYYYWIVIDHDRRLRPDLEKVMQDADVYDVSVADSNPCFEAWLIQHFSTITDIPELSHVKSVKTCDHIIRRHLKRPGFDPDYKKSRLDRDTYMPKVKLAIQNAEFDETAASDSDEFCYTGSRVHLLVKDMIPDA